MLILFTQSAASTAASIIDRIGKEYVPAFAKHGYKCELVVSAITTAGVDVSLYLWNNPNSGKPVNYEYSFRLGDVEEIDEEEVSERRCKQFYSQLDKTLKEIKKND